MYYVEGNSSAQPSMKLLAVESFLLTVRTLMTLEICLTPVHSEKPS